MLRVGRVVNVRTFDLKTDQLDMKLTGFNRPFTTRTLTCTLDFFLCQVGDFFEAWGLMAAARENGHISWSAGSHPILPEGIL